MRIAWLPALALTVVIVGAGCGSSGDSGSPPPDPASERADHPAKPPAGWRTVTGGQAGFTIAVPRGWSVHKHGAVVRIRSDDKLLAISITADRSEPGRDTSARAYAEETMRKLPGFTRPLKPHDAKKVRGSPYKSERVDGQGSLRSNHRSQVVTVAGFHRSGQVTYTVVAFRNATVLPRFHQRELTEALATFRAMPPRV
jgi:hypothetical protein